MFFKKLVALKNDEEKFDNFPKTNEEYLFSTYGCFRFKDSYRFLSINLDSLSKTLFDNSNESLKNSKNEIVDNDEILFTVNEILEDKIIKDSEKVYPDKTKNLEDVLLNFIGEKDLKILKRISRQMKIFN